MAQAKKAEEPSMEEILASIRRIISDEDSQGADTGEADVSEDIETPVAEEAANDMGDASEMSQDDLDKLFDHGRRR
jgi:cell pole-organizing protein PopZ